MDSKVNCSRMPVNYSVAISDIYGNETSVHTSPDMIIEKIKETAIKQMPESESSTNYGQYRLVLVNDIPRPLSDDKTAKQELLQDGDCALLVKNRNKQAVSSLVKDGVVSHEGPSQAAIARATEGLPVFTGSFDKVRSSGNDLSSPTQVEQTFRKVLLALLELSYKFMHFNQDENGTKSKNMEVDSTLLKELVEMGFSEKRASKALRLNNMDKNMAMEWLLSHSEMDSDEEDPSRSQTDEEPMDTSSSAATASGVRTRSRTFVPNPTHLASLMDMGFSKEESTQALRINSNNPNTACEWLLSDSRCDAMEDDSDEPLSPDSELYKALVSNPTIHIGLHDKKVLEALEDMVENPWRRNNWAYESAVGNVLLQILKLYNKYSTTAPQP